MKARILLLAAFAGIMFAQQQPAPLNDQKIVDLVAAGVSQSEVLRLVATAPRFDFDLRPNSSDAMMKAGVSEDVIKAMAARESGTAVAIAPTGVVASGAVATSDRGFTSGRSAPTGAAPVSGAYSVIPASSGAYKLTYDGGSVAGLKAGDDVKLSLDQNQIQIVRGGLNVLTLPAAAIREISYGQDVHRRVGAAIGLATVSFGVGALMALTKSKKHFIGITWDAAGNKGGAAFQANKRDYRGLLAGMEGVSGKKAVDSDTMTVKN